MNVLVWHVHGAWLNAFARLPHEVRVPAVNKQDPDARGLPDTYVLPESVQPVAPDELRQTGVDVVVLQRQNEIELCRAWLGKEPGEDVPAVFVEHNTPQQVNPASRHFLAEQQSIPLVHVTHFNELFWDNGSARTQVIEHAVPDPATEWQGELASAAVVVNDPVRRGRMVGTDLLPKFADAIPVDAFGMQTEQLNGVHPNLTGLGDVAHEEMLRQLARRRVYLHTTRWTSLGLSLIEAMSMGMPVVALATTEAVEALGHTSAPISTDVSTLVSEAERLVGDYECAAALGKQMRETVLERYPLERFIGDWCEVLDEVAA